MLKVDAVIDEVGSIAGLIGEAGEESFHGGLVAEAGEGEGFEYLLEVTVIVFYLVGMDANAEGDSGEFMDLVGDLSRIGPMCVEMGDAFFL